MGELAGLERELEAADVAACGAPRLRELVGVVVKAQRVLAGHMARLAAAASALERSGSGPASEQTLAAGGQVSAREAKNLAAGAKLADLFPKVGQRSRSGVAHPENVRALTAAARSLTAEELALLAGHDAALAHGVELETPDVFVTRLRDRINHIREQRVGDDASLIERQRAASAFSMGPRRDGMWWLSGALDPERARLLNDRINAGAKDLSGDEPVTANHRAEALVGLATRHGGDGGPAPRLGIGIIADAATADGGPHEGSVAEGWDGADVDPATVGRLACNAEWITVWIDRLGRPVASGVTGQAATREQRLALRALYAVCGLDGVTPFSRCEIHHVNVPYVAGGATDLDNLVPVSPEWHHRIHDRGWTLTMAQDRTLTLRRPDGTLDRTVPPPTPITRHGP